MAKFEKTQPGNPYSLTVKQHIFPRSCIERFTSQKEEVLVSLKKDNSTFRTKSTNPIFCAQRSWDERAEHGYMNEIENDYLKIAEKYKNIQGALSDDDARKVIKLFCLWNARFRFKRNKQERITLNGIAGETHKFSKDDEERIEKSGVITIRSDATVAARNINAIHIFLNIENDDNFLKHTPIECVRFKDGNILVPDNFALFPYVPLNSQSIFISANNKHLSWYQLNQISIKSAERYYFSRP